jgi:hypothetical protein
MGRLVRRGDGGRRASACCGSARTPTRPTPTSAIDARVPRSSPASSTRTPTWSSPASAPTSSRPAYAASATTAGASRRTVEATRAPRRDELRRVTAKRAHELRAGGVTTLEIKSGYELDRRRRGASARGRRRVQRRGDLPRRARRARGVRATTATATSSWCAGEMLARCAPLANWADVFCDVGAFDVDESRTILVAAREAGLGLRVHGNQLGDIGGVGARGRAGRGERRPLHPLSDGDVGAGVVAHRRDAAARGGVLHRFALPLGAPLLDAAPRSRWRPTATPAPPTSRACRW